MPNWCEHRIRVSGPTAALATFDHALTGGLTDIANLEHTSLLLTFVPMPEELAGTTSPDLPPHSKHSIENAATDELRDSMLADNETHLQRREALCEQFGAGDWYTWCTQNWGTKWPDRTFAYERKPRSVVLYGDCAWAPPIKGLLTISSQHPQLRFTCDYWEAGNAFRGKLVARDGHAHVAYEIPYSGRRGG